VPIFNIQNKKLQPISEKKFDLEQDIQKLIEANLDTIFGLIFVSGASNEEFFVRAREQDFYIDTLAFDEAQKSFVIIEYKKDKSISVIDQGFAYLSTMLNHKADFVLEINERLQKNFTKKDIDWEQSRIIFISPEFTNYQRNAINFKDLPIFLYEVKNYENNLIGFYPIKPYRTTESIGALSKDKTIQDVSKEVKVYTEENLVSRLERGKDFYYQLKEKILAFSPILVFHPTKTYVGIQREGDRRTIMAVNFQKNKLILDYTRSQPDDFIDPKKKINYKENSMKYFNQHISTLIVESADDVEYAVNIFYQAYERFLKQFSEK